MDLFGIQITVLLCLLLGNILFGCLPLFISKLVGYFTFEENAWTTRIKWSTFMLYIAAGVFISDSLLILLPQANEEFTISKIHSRNQTDHKAEQEHHHEEFPLPEFVVLCGFFLAYVAQEAVHFLCFKFTASKQHRDTRVRFCSCAKRHTECSRTFKDAKPDQTLYGLEKKNLIESENAANPTAAAAKMHFEIEANANAELLRSSILAQTVPNYGAVTNITAPAIDNPLPVMTPAPVLLANERQIIMAQQTELKYKNKLLTSSSLLVLALTLQFVLLGMQLGMRTDIFKRWPYLLVICLQNFILIFSANSYVIASSIEISYAIMFNGLLSVVSPIGMTVSIMDRNAIEKISHLAVGITSAVASGLLLYTTFYEMLCQKFFGGVVGITKFFTITAGASIMAALRYAMLHL